jgi:hypothetical protein
LCRKLPNSAQQTQPIQPLTLQCRLFCDPPNSSSPRTTRDAFPGVYPGLEAQGDMLGRFMVPVAMKWYESRCETQGSEDFGFRLRYILFHITGGITHLRSGMMYNMVNRRISHSQITILMGGIPKTGRFIIGVSHSTAPSAPLGSHSLDPWSRYGCAAAERIAGEAADRRDSF